MRFSLGGPGALYVKGGHACARSGGLRLGDAQRLWGWFVSVALLCTLCTPRLGAAQDDKTKARTLFGEGVAAFERGDFENALESFTQAYRLAPHPAVRVNMANCYEQLGRYAEATFNYQRFLEESGGNISPEQRRDVEAAIARLKLKFGEIVVETNPADVSLSIDGSSAQRGLDGRIQLRAGSHLVRATKPGYVSLERTIEVEGGAEQRVVLELEPLSPPSAAPLAGHEPASAHEEAWQPQSQFEPKQAERSRLRTAMWVSLGAAALCGIGASITGGLAIKAQGDFDDAVSVSNASEASEEMRNQARIDGVNASDRADTLAMTTDVLWVSAAVGAGTAFVLWMVDRKRPEREQSVALIPAASARGDAHLFLRGAF